jgi:hypothetical protein
MYVKLSTVFAGIFQLVLILGAIFGFVQLAKLIQGNWGNWVNVTKSKFENAIGRTRNLLRRQDPLAADM